MSNSQHLHFDSELPSSSQGKKRSKRINGIQRENYKLGAPQTEIKLSISELKDSARNFMNPEYNFNNIIIISLILCKKKRENLYFWTFLIILRHCNPFCKLQLLQCPLLAWQNLGNSWYMSNLSSLEWRIKVKLYLKLNLQNKHPSFFGTICFSAFCIQN